jgi:hypothetical protein
MRHYTSFAQTTISKVLYQTSISIENSFLNNAHPGHGIIVMSTKENNEKLTKILYYTETVFSPYYYKIPNAA